VHAERVYDRRLKYLRVLLSALLTVSATPLFANSVGDHKISFNVPVQAMDTALVAFAGQAHVQLVVATNALKGLPASGVAGDYDPPTALTILLRDTGLEFQFTGPETVTVRPKSSTK
jgi:iron complex outermembrane receptor protein